MEFGNLTNYSNTPYMGLALEIFSQPPIHQPTCTHKECIGDPCIQTLAEKVGLFSRRLQYHRASTGQLLLGAVFGSVNSAAVYSSRL